LWTAELVQCFCLLLLILCDQGLSMWPRVWEGQALAKAG
jgi:hypothetical protein